MTMKASGTAGEPELIDEWDGGFGWIAHPEEGMQRASHALVSAGRVWLVDPVDFEGLDDHIAEYGPVGGVVLLLDRHKRDAAAIARRHDVSVYLPRWMAGISDDLDAPTTLFEGALADTEYTLLKVYDNPFWNEGALYDADSGTLVVPEAFGTVSYYCTSNERLGVHPAMRLTPPRRPFRGLSPERILVGHGPGISTDATGALRDALAGSIKRTPKLYMQTLKSFLPF
ncbi:hypothetical protein [Haladaptatus sp. CMSO5]|uniref:hypothetical protein n=1 Tax=Haladaptatus sp. CMSO5 TaxID=3120514 RepID=UPI002FCE316C